MFIYAISSSSLIYLMPAMARQRYIDTRYTLADYQPPALLLLAFRHYISLDTKEMRPSRTVTSQLASRQFLYWPHFSHRLRLLDESASRGRIITLWDVACGP